MNISPTSIADGSAARKRNLFGSKQRDQLGSFLFVVPYLVFFCAFLGFPLVFGLYISLHHWNPIAGNSGFVGLAQYFSVLSLNTLAGQQFLGSLLHTVIFVVISVPFLVSIPLLVAYGIYRAPLKSVFRPIYFFPTVLSVTAVTSVWTWILATQGGAINESLHLNIPWLVAQPWAWVSIDAATVWWSLGFNMVILYAGLTQLPQTVFDAASIDGAGSIRTFLQVAVPQLKSVITFVVIISTIASFNLFAQPYLMTGGGPGSSTTSVTMAIYNQGFNAMHMGSATAMSFIMGLMLVIIAFIQFRVLRGR